MSKYYIEYKDLDLSNLEDWELKVVDLFKEAAKLCGEIYESQIDPNKDGFYPKGVSIDEIEDAAVPDKKILNPYTKVLKKNNSLEAVFYFEEYKEQVDRLCEVLEEASKLYTENGQKEYSRYLKELVSDLKKADFESSEKIWLKIGNEVNVDIKLGPLETYQDKLFGIKRVFQANLRIRDEAEFKNLTDYIDVINALLPASPFAKDISKSDFVVRIDKVIAMGGWHADLVPSSSNYPADIEQYKNGVKAIIYTNNINSKQHLINKIVKTLIDSSFNDEKKLVQARSRIIIFHEIAEAISKLRYPESYNQLRNYRDQVVEAYANLMGIKSGAVQVLKGFLTTEEYQYILVTFFATVLRGWYMGKVNMSVTAYSVGYKLAFNYFLQKGAISIYENKIQINYAHMYSAIDNVSLELAQIILNKDPKAAADLFETYSSERELNKFEPQLKEIFQSG